MSDSPMICGLRLFLLRMSAVVRKELRQLSRDRMTFGMVIAIPLIQLFLFGYAINTNVRQIPIAVVDQSQTSLSRILQQMVAVTQVVDIKAHYIQVPDAENALRQEKYARCWCYRQIWSAAITIMCRRHNTLRSVRKIRCNR
ncbi:hypothetical protein PCI56_07760 [Plesiomonas shigelloides subsp. oncorhynchi]|nr:hypothetical protein [Plesiomonas shigelloides]